MKNLSLLIFLVSSAAQAHRTPVFEFDQQEEKDGKQVCVYQSTNTGKSVYWPLSAMANKQGDCVMFLWAEDFE